MARSHRRRNPPGHKDLVGLAHGRAWKTMEWFVPFQDDHAIMYHGHEDPEDHSECGPQIFCCPKAAILLRQRHPDSATTTADWEFTDGHHLASWIGPPGPRIFYFFFCDPDDWTVLRFAGVSVPELRGVLHKKSPLDTYLEIADRICGMEK
jgi:hypothetical protein